jgi:hypothetical protein
MQDLCPNSTSNAHTKGTLTADAVQRFLRENNIPVLIENGGIRPYQHKECGGLNADFDSRNPTGRRVQFIFSLSTATLMLISSYRAGSKGSLHLAARAAKEAGEELEYARLSQEEKEVFYCTIHWTS